MEAQDHSTLPSPTFKMGQWVSQDSVGGASAAEPVPEPAGALLTSSTPPPTGLSPARPLHASFVFIDAHTTDKCPSQEQTSTSTQTAMQPITTYDQNSTSNQVLSAPRTLAASSDLDAMVYSGAANVSLYYTSATDGALANEKLEYSVSLSSQFNSSDSSIAETLVSGTPTEQRALQAPDELMTSRVARPSLQALNIDEIVEPTASLTSSRFQPIDLASSVVAPALLGKSYAKPARREVAPGPASELATVANSNKAAFLASLNAKIGLGRPPYKKIPAAPESTTAVPSSCSIASPTNGDSSSGVDLLGAAVAAPLAPLTHTRAKGPTRKHSATLSGIRTRMEANGTQGLFTEELKATPHVDIQATETEPASSSVAPSSEQAAPSPRKLPPGAVAMPGMGLEGLPSAVKKSFRRRASVALGTISALDAMPSSPVLALSLDTVVETPTQVTVIDLGASIAAPSNSNSSVPPCPAPSDSSTPTDIVLESSEQAALSDLGASMAVLSNSASLALPSCSTPPASTDSALTTPEEATVADLGTSIAEPSSSTPPSPPKPNSEATTEEPTEELKEASQLPYTPADVPENGFTAALVCLGSWAAQTASLSNGVISKVEQESAIVGAPIAGLTINPLESKQCRFGKLAFAHRLNGLKITYPLKDCLSDEHYYNASMLLRHLVASSPSDFQNQICIAMPITMDGPSTPLGAWYGQDGNFGHSDSGKPQPAMERFLLSSALFARSLALDHPSAQISFIPAAVATAHHSGRSTALVVNVGHTETRVIPVVEHTVYWAATSFLPLGTHHMLDHFQNTIRYKLVCRTLKEKERMLQLMGQIYVSTSVNDLTQSVRPNALEKSTVYHFQGSDTLGLYLDSKERYAAPEVFFDPEVAVPDLTDGIDRLVSNTLQFLRSRTHPSVGNLCETMAENILLTGRIASLPGFTERLELQIKHLMGTNAPNVKVTLATDHESEIFGLASLASEAEYHCSEHYEAFELDPQWHYSPTSP